MRRRGDGLVVLGMRQDVQREWPLRHGVLRPGYELCVQRYVRAEQARMRGRSSVVFASRSAPEVDDVPAPGTAYVLARVLLSGVGDIASFDNDIFRAAVADQLDLGVEDVPILSVVSTRIGAVDVHFRVHVHPQRVR